MPIAQIELSQEEAETLSRAASRAGKTEEELLKQALERILADEPPADWRERLLKARGIWKDRTDLPPLEELRKEWDRSDRWSKDG